MKLQCSCGAKYAFDITPEMAQNPVRFVCPQCGADSSDFVNQLVRSELGLPPATVAAAAPPPPAPVAAAAPAAPPPPAPPAGSRLKISREEAPTPVAEAAPASKFCPKHRGVPATEQCTVCHKPICPQCMEMFGFFCSPLCKNKADMQGIVAPVYAGQRYNVEARFWRKTGLIAGSIAAAIILFFGTWTWYAWFGSVPHPYFALRFENDPAYSGKVELIGKDLVFLHGGTLARCRLGSKTPIWTQELVTQQQVDDEVKSEADADARMNADGGGGGYHVSKMHDEVVREAKIGLQEALILHVSGQNIWVANGDKMTQYDWATGKPGKDVTLPEAGEDLKEANGELLVYGPESVTHVSLADGSSHTEKIGGAGRNRLASAGDSAGGGLPTTDGTPGQPLDPQKVAAQAQNLKLQARLALPAVIANAQHNQQIEAALRDNPELRHKHDPNSDVRLENARMIPSENGAVQFTSVLLEEKFVEREAMKAAPKKSALDGDVNAAHTGEIANELLNEMQRNNGGSTVAEDLSRYRVTVHLPNSPDVTDWTAEVTGSPSIFPLKTVTVVSAGKTVIVLDKNNKLRWQATLTYPILNGERELSELFGRKSEFGDGPCVEHGDALYIFDQAVLSAFDLASGNARWRLPSVGVAGLFFDDHGDVYVNTTSGNPDDIKYSRQIDITKTTDDIVMKVDSKTGKTLWSIKPGGFVSYVSGKFIYLTQSNDPNPQDTPALSDTLSGFQKPPFFRILRVNPKNGRTMFDYYQDRAPFYVHFDDNTIEVVFKKEVQILKYLTF